MEYNTGLFIKSFGGKNADELISIAIQYAEEHNVEMVTKTEEVRKFYNSLPYILTYIPSYEIVFKKNDKKETDMEKVTINGKEYTIDIDKCKEQGLLTEEFMYPKTWEEFREKSINNPGWFDVGYYNPHAKIRRPIKECSDEEQAFIALGKLIQLRDWWWDNICDGWRPDWTNNSIKYCFYVANNYVGTVYYENYSCILAFPNSKIGDLFYETYKDLIEEAKMFL